MKTTHKILTALIAMAATACSNPLEEQLLGNWTLDQYQIIHLDSICDTKAAAAKTTTTKAIELARHQLDSAKTAQERKDIQEKIQQLQQQLSTYTTETFKNEYTQIANEQIGQMTINFQTGKYIQVKVAGSPDKQAGTWKVSNDTISTLFDNQPAEILIVKNITSNTLTLFSPALDEQSLDLVMKFSKK